LENQLEDPGEMTVFWYTCKHSDPNDVADILSKVYSSISNSSNSLTCEDKKAASSDKKEEINVVERTASPYNPVLPVTPGMIEPGKIPSDGKKLCTSNNFVVDPKTSSILMTIRKDDIEKIKSLLKKLDVPKKMTQIDVLLVERKIQDRKQSGINILKIGTHDIHRKENAFSFDDSRCSIKKGILDFIFSKPKGNFPSFDLTLSFLMAQDNLKVNANPSILAINQTPAQISIMEELSINNGAVAVDGYGYAVQKSYTRAQFGISIVMTPTIHLADPERGDEKGYVTLQTNVTFDSTHAAEDDRPPVTRRHIENEVRIADGETIILGGLRKKQEEDSRDKIPFLGDLPGIGKLFGTSKLTDSSTEMFIFITPRIIKDPIEDLRIERQRMLMRRPGDIPEFLEKIEEAKLKERKKLFANSLKVIFE
jgi:general secretion pathway protein D